MDPDHQNEDTITFFCGSCGDELTRPKSEAGASCACPACSAPNLVPSPAAKETAKPELASVRETIIKFFCLHCGQKLSSPAAFVGRSFECPTCAKGTIVPGEKAEEEAARPAPAELIKFFCCGCGQKLSVDAKVAGHTIDCPICAAPTKVPKAGAAPAIKPAAPALKPAAVKPPQPSVIKVVPPTPPKPAAAPAVAKQESPAPEKPAEDVPVVAKAPESKPLPPASVPKPALPPVVKPAAAPVEAKAPESKPAPPASVAKPALPPVVKPAAAPVEAKAPESKPAPPASVAKPALPPVVKPAVPAAEPPAKPPVEAKAPESKPVPPASVTKPALPPVVKPAVPAAEPPAKPPVEAKAPESKPVPPASVAKPALPPVVKPAAAPVEAKAPEAKPAPPAKQAKPAVPLFKTAKPAVLPAKPAVQDPPAAEHEADGPTGTQAPVPAAKLPVQSPPPAQPELPLVGELNPDEKLGKPLPKGRANHESDPRRPLLTPGDSPKKENVLKQASKSKKENPGRGGKDAMLPADVMEAAPEKQSRFARLFFRGKKSDSPADTVDDAKETAKAVSDQLDLPAVDPARPAAAKAPPSDQPAAKRKLLTPPAVKLNIPKAPAPTPPAAKESAPKSSDAQEPAAQEPAAKKPAAKLPAVKKPAAKKPAEKDPACASPAEKKAVANDPLDDELDEPQLGHRIASRPQPAKQRVPRRSPAKNIVEMPRDGEDGPVRLTNPLDEGEPAGPPKLIPIDDLDELGELEDDFDLEESGPDHLPASAGGRRRTILPPRRAGKDPVGARKKGLKGEVSDLMSDEEGNGKVRDESPDDERDSGFVVQPSLPPRKSRKKANEK